MPELPSLHEATVDAIVGHAGGATLPFQEAQRDAGHATFFWFNELVEHTADGEVVRQFLVTAGELTRGSASPRWPSGRPCATPPPARGSWWSPTSPRAGPTWVTWASR
jgi:hypothetical protein